MKGKIVTGKEIIKITRECPPREKAFFTIMRQSGLPPHIIKQLKVRDVERISEPNTSIPCRISVPHEKRPTYIGEEAVKYTKRYLKTRKDLTPESPLFTIRNDQNKEINIKSESRTFTTIARKVDRSIKLTLYSLIGFYRMNAKEYLTELKRYDTSKDDELYRQLYEEKAMPFLEIEPPSPIEIHQLKKRQQELENELNTIENLFPKEQEDEYGKYLEEHPEEARQIREQTRARWEQTAKEIDKKMKDDEKWREEHPEEAKLRDEAIDKYEEQLYKEHLEEEVKIYREFYEIIGNIVRKSKDRAKKHGKTLS
jgi:hypothetical protein